MELYKLLWDDFHEIVSVQFRRNSERNITNIQMIKGD